MLEQVEITELHDGTFFAEICLRRGEETLRISSRPSDAIALAVRMGHEVPILAAEAVLDEAGVVYEPRGGRPRHRGVPRVPRPGQPRGLRRLNATLTLPLKASRKWHVEFKVEVEFNRPLTARLNGSSVTTA